MSFSCEEEEIVIEIVCARAGLSCRFKRDVQQKANAPSSSHHFYLSFYLFRFVYAFGPEDCRDVSIGKAKTICSFIIQIKSINITTTKHRSFSSHRTEWPSSSFIAHFTFPLSSVRRMENGALKYPMNVFQTR